jgi:preprotein translocase subunit SecY
MVGIIAECHKHSCRIASRTSQTNGGVLMIVMEIIIWLLVIVACGHLLVMAVRKIKFNMHVEQYLGDF